MVNDRRQPHQGSPARSRGKGQQPRYGAHKRGLNSKIHLAVDANGIPVRVFVTAGTVHDCREAIPLIDGIFAEWLLADRGYDSNKIIEKAVSQNMNVVIPPKKNRRVQREYDQYLYKLRHLIENTFLHLKR